MFKTTEIETKCCTIKGISNTIQTAVQKNKPFEEKKTLVAPPLTQLHTIKIGGKEMGLKMLLRNVDRIRQPNMKGKIIPDARLGVRG